MDELTGVVGKAASAGRFTFVHVLGNFQYANQRISLRDRLVVLPECFEDELYGFESLWIRSRLIALFGVNQPTGHCMQTILNFQIVAIAKSEDRTEMQFIPVLISDTSDGVIGDFGYDGEPALRFQQGLDSSIKNELTEAIVSLLISAPNSLGIFFDYMACDYDGSIETIACDGSRFHREFLGYLNPFPAEECHTEDNEGWWPFELPRAKRRRSKRTPVV